MEFHLHLGGLRRHLGRLKHPKPKPIVTSLLNSLTAEVFVGLVGTVELSVALAVDVDAGAVVAAEFRRRTSPQRARAVHRRLYTCQHTTVYKLYSPSSTDGAATSRIRNKKAQLTQRERATAVHV